MKVLIACEFSGIVRDAFLEKGHDAVSCDLENTEIPGPHLMGDIREYLECGWDMMISHVPCTYLCNSGVRWLHTEPGRMFKMTQARHLFYDVWNAPIPKICMENPIPHKYAALPKYTQIVQPWMFGDGETKATCLWLKGLPKLYPDKIVEGRYQKIHLMSPGKDRGKERSRTYRGLARAMAEQWG